MSTQRKRYGKRILAILMSVLMLFSVVPVNLFAFAVEDESTSAVEESTEGNTAESTEASTEESTQESTEASTEGSTEESTDETETKEKFDVTVSVVDSEGNALSDVKVSYSVNKKDYKTDEAGNAVISDVEEGVITVSAEKSGYKTESTEVSISKDSTSVRITLYKEYVYQGSVTYPENLAEEFKGYRVNVAASDGNSYEATINGADFELKLVETVNYDVTVVPTADKVFSPVKKSIGESLEGTYELDYIDYSVYVNDIFVRTATYGEQIDVNLKQEGYALSKDTAVTSGDESVVYTINNDNNDIISFVVKGTTVITPAYNYSITVSSDANGTVTVNGTAVSGQNGVPVIIKKGEVASYSIKAKPGYRIDTVKFNDEIIVNGNNEKTTVDGTLSASGNLVATFAEVKCTANVTLQNSKTGDAKLSRGDWKISVEPGISSDTDKIVVGINEFNSEKGTYTITLDPTVDKHHELEIKGGEGYTVKLVDGKYVITAGKLDINVNATVSAKEYTVNYIDPFSKVESDVFTVESEKLELPTPEKVNGFSFLGWADKAPDMITSKDDVIDTLICEKQEGNVTLYAVYVVDTVSVAAKSVQTFNGETKETAYILNAGEANDQISNNYFGNDVELFLDYSAITAEGREITVTVTAEENGAKNELGVIKDAETDKDKYVVYGLNGSGNKTTDVSLIFAVKMVVGDVTFTYASIPGVGFTVNHDSISPSLTVSKDGENNKLEFEDKESGVSSIQVAYIDMDSDLASAEGIAKLLECVKNGQGTDQLNSEVISEIKATLRKIDSWSEIEPDGLGKNVATHQFDAKKNEYIVYRVIDKAGNDVYSSFDRTIPVIKYVKYTYPDNSSAGGSDGSGSIYTNGNVNVNAIISDKYLFFKNDKNDKYADCQLYVTYYNDNNELKKMVISPVDSDEKWSLFHDEWSVDFVISKSDLDKNKLLNRELGFGIVAYDQAGNASEDYTFDGVMVVEDALPKINVEYTYNNHSSSVTEKVTNGTTVYSMAEVTANITVTGEFFDPYCDADKKSAAEVKVFVDGSEDKSVEFTKQSDKWTAAVTFTDDGEHFIKVAAYSQSGNSAELETGKVIIDTAEPVIDISYNLDNDYILNADNVFYGKDNADGTFTIKVTDNHLAPFYGEKTDKSTILANLKGGENESALKKEQFSFNNNEYTVTSEVFEDEGSYVLTVSVTDQAGNVRTRCVNLHSDRTAATIKNVSIEKSNKFSFGNFFNEKAILTVVCEDGTNTYSSGCQKVVLYYGAEEPAICEVVDGVATFELPLKEVDNWSANLSLIVIDNVNNESKELKIDELSGNNITGDNIISNYVLYEKQKPSVTLSFGTADDSVFYVEGDDEKTLWILKGKSVTFNVSDDITDVPCSGLETVSVMLMNAEVDGKTTYYEYSKQKNDDGTDKKTESASYEYIYSDLAEGKNVFFINAIDNAGNRMDSVTYVVYKDIEAPEITSVDLSASGEESSGNILKFGNFYNGDIALDISGVDNSFSSGIASIEVKYINDVNENVILVETDHPDDSVEERSDVAGNNISFARNFICEAIENAEGYFTIEIVDNVGNTTVFGSENQSIEGIKSNMSINHLMFEKTKSDITLGASEPVFKCEGEEAVKDWYNTDDITIDSLVTDIVGDNAVSGINEFTMSLNGDGDDDVAVNKTLGDEISADEKTTDDETSINLSGCGKDNSLKAVDGENIVTVTTTDNASNTNTDTIKVYVDRVNPEVASFSFKRAGDDDEFVAEKCSTVTVTDYGYFFAEDTEVTVYVKDACPSSGIKEIHFSAIPVYDEYNGLVLTKIIDDVSTACATESKLKDSTEEGLEQTSSATFIVPAGFKGQVYAYVVDNVGNDSLAGPDVEDYENWKHPYGLIVETQQMHDSHESIAKHISIAEKTTPIRYLDGDKNPLYNDNAELTITVIDTYSGIRKVEYSVEAAYDTGNNYSETLDGITPGGEMLSGWEYSTELNLVTTMRKTITVANNSNDILVKVKMTDNSGNTSYDEFILSIDKDAPIITVNFDKAENDDDAEYTGFFKTDRKMTVSILERNFDPAQVLITAQKDLAAYNISATELRNYSFAPSDRNVDGKNIQFYEYVLVHNFTEDGDYEFAIEATDLAENKTEDNNVNYGSAATKEVAKKFTIDKTVPKITVTISGVEFRDTFYSDNLAFTVAIEEHNYAAERYTPVFVVKKPVTKEIIGYSIPTPHETHENDMHTYTYDFTEEYIYELQSVAVIDMAGNDAKDETLHIASLDRTDPKIEILYSAADKEGASIASNNPLDRVATNAATFRPEIIISDAFLDTSTTDYYSITLRGNYNGYISNDSGYGIRYNVNTSADSSNNLYVSTISYNNFEAEEDIDDIYVLTVTAQDQAGRITEKSVMFSLNRFGSTFMVDNSTHMLLNNYYTNEPQNVKLIQINAAEIEDGRISMERDSVSTDLVLDSDYTETKTYPGNISSGSGTATNWYECVYDINKDNFNQDGMYSITVYTADSAENSISSALSQRTINLFKDNKPENSTLVEDDGSLDAPVNFLVDTVKPTTSISGLENDQYFTGSHQIVFYANDDVKIKDVYLYASTDADANIKNLTHEAKAEGEAAKNGTIYDIKATGGSGIQYITLVAHDMAGNEYVSEAMRVQVTTNPIQWFLHNTIAIMIAATLLVAALVVIIILIKRKRDKGLE